MFTAATLSRPPAADPLGIIAAVSMRSMQGFFSSTAPAKVAAPAPEAVAAAVIEGLCEKAAYGCRIHASHVLFARHLTDLAHPYSAAMVAVTNAMPRVLTTQVLPPQIDD